MNDERMQSLLDAWYRDRDEAPRDADSGISRVMADVPQTRQRSRWWPFPIFYRRTQSPTTATTVVYQPDPIPATNGHTPTVIGRTTSMLSPVKAITAGAIIFALGGAFLVAQPFQQQSSVPAAEVEPAEAVEFTVYFPWGPVLEDATEVERPDGSTEGVGFLARSVAARPSDPRFDGDLLYGCSYIDYAANSPDQSSVGNCVYRIENDEGAWLMRPNMSLEFPGDPGFGPYGVFTAVFDGEGAYEGLTAVVEITEVAWQGNTLHGLIINTDLPQDPPPHDAQ
jgi:hypothetical protein